MKKLTYIFLSLLVLAGCTTRQEYATMRQGLDSINERNRNDEPFTANDVQPYVDFFDRHGEPNDRMLAHYLLGRAYHEQGEAPMALQCYQQAIECTDTLSEDCDFAQLSRVYAQMGELFYYQKLHLQQLSAYKKAIYYSYRADRIQSAINHYEQLSSAYEMLGDMDSAIIVMDSVIEWYRSNNMNQDAAISMGRTTSMLIHQKDYEKARRYMSYYEQSSGLFDDHGDIEKGYEIYYYYKGLTLLENSNVDSAEYYFRKDYYNAKDYNNQQAAAKGLAMLFEKIGISDSASKYYKYAYAMNDSMYAQMTTSEVERMQAMYDYTRHQEIARKKTEEARTEKTNRQIAVGIILFIVLLFGLITFYLIRKEKKGLDNYRKALDELKTVRSEKAYLKLHETEYEQLISNKEKRIAELEKFISKYGKQLYFTKANAERCLHESRTYKRIEDIAIKGQNLTEEDWKDIKILIAEYIPGFDDFMTTNQSLLIANEYPICILLRLHFKATDIAGMLSLSKSQVSQLCSDIIYKLFEIKGSSKKLSAKLAKIF